MVIKLLTQKDFPVIQKFKKIYSELRVVSESGSSKLEQVEIFNKEGKYRGFGRSTKEAFMNALKAFVGRKKSSC